jgi:hypothetical protein
MIAIAWHIRRADVLRSRGESLLLGSSTVGGEDAASPVARPPEWTIHVWVVCGGTCIWLASFAQSPIGCASVDVGSTDLQNQQAHRWSPFIQVFRSTIPIHHHLLTNVLIEQRLRPYLSQKPGTCRIVCVGLQPGKIRQREAAHDSLCQSSLRNLNKKRRCSADPPLSKVSLS